MLYDNGGAPQQEGGRLTAAEASAMPMLAAAY